MCRVPRVSPGVPSAQSRRRDKPHVLPNFIAFALRRRMSSTTTPHGTSLDPQSAGGNESTRGFHLNQRRRALTPTRSPKGFLQFLEPLHKRFSPLQQELVTSARPLLPLAPGPPANHLPPGEAQLESWDIPCPTGAGSAQSDDRPAMKRARRQDAQLRRSRRHARP